MAMLFRVNDLSQAIQLANDTPFGLAASAWTRDPAEQQRLVTELQCGSVFLNAMVASDPRLPFGGIKRSGYGRELSAAGMREFLNAKTVVIASRSRRTGTRRAAGAVAVSWRCTRGLESRRSHPVRAAAKKAQPDFRLRLRSWLAFRLEGKRHLERGTHLCRCGAYRALLLSCSVLPKGRREFRFPLGVA